MRLRASAMTPSNGVEFLGSTDCLNKARMRLTISAAELASRMIRPAEIFARSRFGGAADSQRWHALALATIAASGRFTPWAIEAESSAKLAAWVGLASLSEARRSASWNAKGGL